MWIVLSLVAAIGSAGTSLLLKRAVRDGGVVVSTVAFRLVGGVLLGSAFSLFGVWPTLTPAFWRTLAIVTPFEVGGMLFLTLALRIGDLSMVQPLMGLIPLIVMFGGVVFLHEVPSRLAAVGIVLVAAGLYCVGLRKGSSWLEPIRALATSRASWFGVTAALFWSVTSLFHKIGIAIVGPIPWGTSLTFSSAIVLAFALPLIAWKRGSIGIPARVGPWMRIIALLGLSFAIQLVGLHNALQRAQAGYVIAVQAMSILLATVMGVFLLREQGGSHRLAGALLVSGGVGLIALFG
jgi:drug/metabolite transporter (DMT)-like permease